MTQETPALKRELGRWQSYATLMGTMIGSGIFVVTGSAGAQAGPSVIVAYALLGPALLATALAYAVYSSTPLGTQPGGAYSHITRTHGFYLIGYLAGWLKCIAYIGSLAVLSLSTGQYLTFFWKDVDPVVVAVAMLVLFYLINLLGVRFFGRVQLGMFLLLVIAVVLLVVPGLFAIDSDNLTPFLPFGWSGLFVAMAPLFYSYQGFESLAQAAGETKDARRQIPKRFFVGVGGAMVVYVSMSFVAFGVVPFRQLAASDSAMALVASRYLPFGAAAIVAIGAIMAFTTSTNACLMIPSRLTYVMASDRVIPRRLARINMRLRTPDLALTACTALAIVLVVSRTLDYMADAVVQSFLLLYGIHSLTLVALPFVRPALLQKAWFRPPTWLLVAAGLFSAACLGYLTYITLPTVIWLITGWTAVGLVLYTIGRFSGKREGFDYAGNLAASWVNDTDVIGNQADATRH